MNHTLTYIETESVSRYARDSEKLLKSQNEADQLQREYEAREEFFALHGYYPAPKIQRRASYTRPRSERRKAARKTQLPESMICPQCFEKKESSRQWVIKRNKPAVCRTCNLQNRKEAQRR